jgi:hypothetical protein
VRLTKLVLLSSVLLLTSPIFATTYWGGFEDVNSPSADYDYNDLVYSITGDTLTLNSAGSLFAKPAVLNAGAGASGLSGSPFWNNTSLDGAGGRNVGFCIYGGGACGAGFAPGDRYLATGTGPGGSANDVFFSVASAISTVTAQVALSITANTDALGWQLVGGGPIHLFGSGVQGPITFTPGGNFVLVGVVTGGPTFTSNTAASDGVSHFAFFAPASVPEPSTVGLLGFALLAGGLAFRKRKSSAHE